MQKRKVILLSTSDSVIETIRAAAPGQEINTVACLSDVNPAHSGAAVVIDPGAVRACCLSTLELWQEHHPVERLIYLCVPAPPAVLIALGQAHPGSIAEMEDIRAVLERDQSGAPPRAAWLQRERLLNRLGPDRRQRQFVSLAKDHSHGRCSESQAAAALHVGVRHLCRLARRWFGYPPRIVLGLPRIERLARELRETGAGLKALASSYGYASRQAMSRQFLAYTGLTPAAYRSMIQSARMSENGATRSDLALSPKPSTRLI